jgi:hypothetical protein
VRQLPVALVGAVGEEGKKVSPLSSRQVVFMMVLKCDGQMPLGEMCVGFRSKASCS